MALALVAFIPFDHTYAPATAQAQQTPLYNENQGTYDHPQKPPKPTPSGVLFNCYLYVKSTFHSLPPTAEIRANLQKEPAEVVVFNYNGIPHYAVNEGTGTSTISISETNYKKGQLTHRIIPMSDPSIEGYFDI